MLFAAIAALLGSAASAYLIGYAFVAPREAFVRSKRGILVLVLGGISLIPLPPQLVALEDAVGPMSGMLGSAGSAALAWPTGLGKGLYLGLWITSTLVALLAGMRIWQVGSADWGGRGGRAYDASGASRVESLVPLADCIEDALDSVARSRITERDVPRVAEVLRAVGRRFSDSLPPSDSEVFRLVAARVPAAIAGAVTGLLLEGAGRRAARG